MAKSIERILEECGVCHYCGEPFKECDTVIPEVGVIVGEVDIEEYESQCWHYGCITDFKKENY